jgi:2-dehydro-3-deoxy-D-arabinonate dehydratase
MMQMLESVAEGALSDSHLVAPIDPYLEVWASGVTYLRSRVERESESTVADVYAKVYEAERPELFFKTLGWRAAGPDSEIRIRRDSSWNVPEPELTLVINAFAEIVGYTIGNDVSSRSIEGENPLYLPQAKSYDGSCALGPEIVVMNAEGMKSLNISLRIRRDGKEIFQDETSISQMKRQLPELVEFLVREMTFPNGAFLMTGTGIVPSHPFTLEVNDIVQIRIGELLLTNIVSS